MKEPKRSSHEVRRIEKLLAHYEHIVAALRTTLALLQVDVRADRKDRATSVLSQALDLDAARRANGNGHAHDNGHEGSARPKKYNTKDAQQQRRQRTAEFLAGFSHDKPQPAINGQRMGIGPLIAAGYLKRKGDGYLRTTKEFVP